MGSDAAYRCKHLLMYLLENSKLHRMGKTYTVCSGISQKLLRRSTHVKCKTLGLPQPPVVAQQEVLLASLRPSLMDNPAAQSCMYGPIRCPSKIHLLKLLTMTYEDTTRVNAMASPSYPQC